MAMHGATRRGANMVNRRTGSRGSGFCPHCQAPLRTRDSEQLTPTVRELRLQCIDLDCAATYVATWSIERQIEPSRCPNPRIRLPGPLPGPRRREAAPDAANDQIELAAQN